MPASLGFLDVPVRTLLLNGLASLFLGWGNGALLHATEGGARAGEPSVGRPRPAALPLNDQFADAIDLGQETNFTVFGDNQQATAEANEPKHCQLAITPSHSLWWKWTPPATKRYLLDTGGSEFNTVVAVYAANGSPPTLANLKRTECGYDRQYADDPNDHTSFIQLGSSETLQPGKTYWFAVDTQDGTTGKVQLSLQEDVPPFGLTLSVDNLSPGGVLTNPADITIRMRATGIVSAATFQVLDSGFLIFERQVTEVNGVDQSFVWQGVPLGEHHLQLKVIKATKNASVEGPTFDFSVAPRPLGIARIDNFATDPSPPRQGNDTETDTSVSGTVVVKNQTTAPTANLRLRMIHSGTVFKRGQINVDPGPVDRIVSQFDPVDRGPLAPGGEWSVDFAPSLDIVCREFNQSGDHGTQYHIIAVLEEFAEGRWIVLDRAKIFSSVAKGLIPPNQGVTGKASALHTGLFTYVTDLAVNSPASLMENSQTLLGASVRFSDESMAVVNPAWSVNPPFTIDAAGVLSVGALSADATATVTATYTRSIQTFTKTIQVTTINLPDPVTLEWATPADITYGAALGANQLNATANVAGQFTYNPAAGVILPAGVDQTLSVTFVPSNPGNPNTTVTRKLNVQKAPLTVTAANASRSYGAANPVFSGSLTGVQTGDAITASYTSAAGPGSAVGTYPITPALEDPAGKRANYTVTLNAGTLTVTRAAQSIAFDSIPDQILGAPAALLKAVASSSLPVTFVLESGKAVIEADTVKPTQAGTITLRAEQTGNSNYLAATPVARSFVAIPTSLQIHNFSVVGGMLHLGFAGSATRQYALEFSRNLETWSKVATLDSDSTGHGGYDGPLPIDGTAGYYRLRLSP